MKNISRRSGFMQIVILAVVIIAALAYFNIDLRTVVQEPIVQKYWNIVLTGWDLYVKPIATWIWGAISSGISSGITTK